MRFIILLLTLTAILADPILLPQKDNVVIGKPESIVVQPAVAKDSLVAKPALEAKSPLMKWNRPPLVKMHLGRPEHGLVHPPPIAEEERVKGVKSVQVAYFTQKLDHNSPQDTRTWRQQYMTNSAYAQANGPIFVMIGGEGPISTGWMDWGWWKECAMTYGAMMYQLEHRYFGKSHPTPDATLSNMQWLTSDQALADLAYFITSIKQSTGKPNAKVVVFGGSYPGNLAAWFRLKYPHVTVGSIASSAPVYAESDFYQYMETVGYALDYVSPGCNQAVTNAFTQLNTMYNQRQFTQLNTILNPCTPFDPTDIYNKAGLFQSLAGQFQGNVQYNNQGHYSVSDLCNIMLDTTGGTELHRLAYLYQTDSRCLNYDWKGIVPYLQETQWSDSANSGGTRQWIYMTCNQFGYYQSTDSRRQPFGYQSVPATFLEDIYCRMPFGLNFTTIEQNVKMNNLNFGGMGLTTSNVVLPNGSVDPWHNLGVLNSVNPSETTEFVTGTSHCFDMRSPGNGDPAQMTMVRNVIKAKVGEFLSN